MKRSKKIVFNHDLNSLNDACDISKELFDKINEFGNIHFTEELKDDFCQTSKRIERIIHDTREILHMDHATPITEYEVILCLYSQSFEFNMLMYEMHEAKKEIKRIQDAENDPDL